MSQYLYLRIALFAMALVFTFTFSGQIRAEEIRFIVGYSPGGSFDAYTRMIARHFGKHMPGNPRVLVQNMTGAGGLIAANYLYNKAKPNGRTIVAFAAPLVLQNVMGNEATKFDGRHLAYLGVPSAYDTVCTFTEKSGIETVDDWKNSKRPVKIGAIGPGTSTSDVPKLLKEATGFPTQVIDGYRGGAGVRLALERDEIDGYCGSWQTLKSINRAAVDSGKIALVLQTSLKPHPEIKDVPLAMDYAKDERAKELLRLADQGYRGQFVYALPPGMAEEKVEQLQKAFMATLQDPELLEEARRSKLEIDPIDGPTTAKTMENLYGLEPATVEKIKELLVPQK